MAVGIGASGAKEDGFVLGAGGRQKVAGDPGGENVSENRCSLGAVLGRRDVAEVEVNVGILGETVE